MFNCLLTQVAKQPVSYVSDSCWQGEVQHQDWLEMMVTLMVVNMIVVVVHLLRFHCITTEGRPGGAEWAFEPQIPGLQVMHAKGNPLG